MFEVIGGFLSYYYLIPETSICSCDVFGSSFFFFFQRETSGEQPFKNGFNQSVLSTYHSWCRIWIPKWIYFIRHDDILNLQCQIVINCLHVLESHYRWLITHVDFSVHFYWTESISKWYFNTVLVPDENKWHCVQFCERLALFLKYLSLGSVGSLCKHLFF